MFKTRLRDRLEAFGMWFIYFRFVWQRVAILIVLFAAPLMAMAQNARVAGTITDPSGLAIQGAAVMVQNEATNVRHEMTSSSTGDFNVPGLEPGEYYIVRAEKPGFESLSRTGVTLFIATETRVDLRLSVGQQTQMVTVNGEASSTGREVCGSLLRYCKLIRSVVVC